MMADLSECTSSLNELTFLIIGSLLELSELSLLLLLSVLLFRIIGIQVLAIDLVVLFLIILMPLWGYLFLAPILKWRRTHNIIESGVI